MVADSVHVLVGVALVTLVYRTDDAVPYLAATLVAAFPDVDLFLFAFLVRGPSAPVFAHRGITHSLFAAAVVVALFVPVGQWRVAAMCYGSHLLLDCLTGEAMLLAPVVTDTYGVALNWYLVNAAVGGLSIAVVVGAVVAFARPDAVARVRRRVDHPSGRT